MGKRDYRWKETKKPKKDTKKIPSVIIEPPTATVEVIKTKGKKEESTPEEES